MNADCTHLDQAAEVAPGSEGCEDDIDNDEASIERTITLPADLPTEQRDRLADIAERTPVTLAVRRGTPITTVIEPAT